MNNAKYLKGIEPEEHSIGDGDGERVVIGLFRSEDGPGIARLFQTVYGEGYPVRRFYDPSGLADAHESGESYSLTARKPDGEIIGHMALFRSSPFPNLYEAGAGLVLPEYRKAGINKLLLTHLYERVAPGLGVDEVWGEAVCNHIIMQRTVAHYKHIETGLEVDLMPAETYEQEKSASGRVASVVCFRAYQSRPHTVYLPLVYEAELRFLYGALDDRRVFESSREPLPTTVQTRVTTQTFEFARVSRIGVTALGDDFTSVFETVERELLARPTRVIQVWLNLACPWAGPAVTALRARGYFLGGVLPRWFDDDGILLQKIIGTPDWDGINLYSDRARDILKLVKTDWERVEKGW
ncbi:MAG: GNAT family N-acetyltransferase [Syntrophobacteraceae bacterium]